MKVACEKEKSCNKKSCNQLIVLHKFWVFQKLLEAVKKLKNLPYSNS